MVRENAYTDNTGNEYTLAWCEKYRKLCLENFDLNMKYFHLLNKEDFNNAVDIFINDHDGFSAVDDLCKYDDVSGYYMMVLDTYKQAYIGKSENVAKRIKQHWTATKAFDRTLFPMYAVTKSCFSIDFFRALDTTRIFVWKRALSDGLEKELVEDFPSMYRTNRIGGDVSNLIEAIETMNVRNL